MLLVYCHADMLLVTQQLLAAWASWKGAIRRRARQSTALLAGPDLHGYQQGEACIGGLDKLPVQSCGKAAVDSKRPVLWSSSSALLQAVQVASPGHQRTPLAAGNHVRQGTLCLAVLAC